MIQSTVYMRCKRDTSRRLTPATPATQGYVVREKLFSISGEDFSIETEEGASAFDVVGSNKVPCGDPSADRTRASNVRRQKLFFFRSARARTPAFAPCVV